MNGPIAQAVALACHANAALRGANVSSFFPANSTCQFCDRISFVEFGKPSPGTPKEVVVADNPATWFSLLQRAGCRGVLLRYESTQKEKGEDRLSAGFVGGGGSWFLEAVGASAESDLWASRWEVWNQNALEKRIWRVTYGAVARAPSTAASRRRSVEQVRSLLTAALEDILHFSSAHAGGGFRECFESALRVLETGSLAGVYHQDLAPPGALADPALTILGACQKAWVFGGMGSWNDMWFEGDTQQDYERVSDQLFQALNDAIAIAASSSAGWDW